MKRTIVSVCVMTVVMLTVSIAHSQTTLDYKSKIESLDKEIAKGMLEGNTQKILSLYTEDAISLPSYSPLLDGIAAIRKSNEEMAKMGAKYDSFTLTTLKILTGGNLITEIGTYQLSISMPKMDKPMADHGKYLTIWEKQKDGSLKIKVETWNSDVDPMGMMKQEGDMDAIKK